MKMVEIIVKKPFIDRETGLLRKENEKLSVTDKRFREMMRADGYVEAVKKPEKAKKADKPEKE